MRLLLADDINIIAQPQPFRVRALAATQLAIWPQILMNYDKPLPITSTIANNLGARSRWFSFIFRMFHWLIVKNLP